MRRAGVQLSMTEGFHPKARLSFPLALAVGVKGENEVLEVDFNEAVEPAALTKLLEQFLPPGLVLKSLELVPPGTRKAQVERVVYEVTIPCEDQQRARVAAERLMSQSEVWIERPLRKQRVNLRENLVALEWTGNQLRIEQTTARTATANPREILQQLGLEYLEQQGFCLTRTRVDLVATAL